MQNLHRICHLELPSRSQFYLIFILIVIRMRTLPEWDLGNLGRLYDVICIT